VVAIALYLALRDSVVGSVSARVGLVALFPGSLLGGRLIEWLSRPGQLTREAIQTLALATSLGINAMTWAIIGKAIVARSRKSASIGAA